MTRASAQKLLAAGLIMAATGLVYSNAWQGTFVFDDISTIVENPHLRDLRHFPDFFTGGRFTNPFRAIPAITFALNYHVHRLAVEGYHLVNILLHAVNGLLVAMLVRSLLSLDGARESSLAGIDPSRTPLLAGRPWALCDRHSYLPLLIALAWVTHPIQTSGVTYITQRHGELATFFYLAGTLAFMKGSLRQGVRRGTWWFLAGLSSVCGLLSKETAVTLPLTLIVAYGLLIHRPDERVPLRASPSLFALMATVLSGLGWFVWRSDLLRFLDRALHPPDAAHWGMGQNLLTECNVIVQYLSLLAFPSPMRLSADRQIALAASLFEFPTGLSILILLACLALAWSLRRREPLLAFGICWFFITLLPDSSIIPLDDLMVEYRLYLPSIGFWLTVILVLDRVTEAVLAERGIHHQQPALVCALVACGLVVPFGFIAHARNTVWQDDMTFWQDIVRKDPAHIRGHMNLGKSYLQIGRLDDAEASFRLALTLAPSLAVAHNNLGTVHHLRGNREQALAHYRRAIELDPTMVDAHNNLGTIYRELRQFDRARTAYQDALRLNPDHDQVHFNLGVLDAGEQHWEEALASFRNALTLNRHDPKIPYALGVALEALHRPTEAEQALRESLARNPAFLPAQESLRNLTGRHDTTSSSRALSGPARTGHADTGTK